ncbi:hypothetical protein PCL_13043 [Purpureocillium lilacinum]|uniref:UBL3-like ubiquitin domain-containing protein n=1 Tax=Purpureocillium lilacinum TaxID=33203 RepID=A0A2U3E840_PURLI|nr:hypothetical protein PCL_13043 [Purpureocillium lilacinum]
MLGNDKGPLESREGREGTPAPSAVPPRPDAAGQSSTAIGKTEQHTGHRWALHRRAGHSGTQTRTSSPSPLTSCLFSGRRLQKTASKKPVGPRASPAATAPWPGASLSPPSSAFGASHDSCRISRNLEFIILRFPCTRTTLIVSNDQPQSRQQTKARPRHSPSSVPPGAAAVACSRSLDLVDPRLAAQLDVDAATLLRPHPTPSGLSHRWSSSPTETWYDPFPAAAHELRRAARFPHRLLVPSIRPPLVRSRHPAPPVRTPEMESTMSGGNSTSVDDARLEQPSDAVPMETIDQSSAPEKVALKAADGPASAQDAVPASTAAHGTPADSERPAHAEADAQATPQKGKDRDDDAPTPPSKERSDSMAIGPAQDDIRAVSHGATDNPVCNITLLLTSGSRHPYKLDAKYLTRRNVAMPEETESGQPDPFSISVYTLKELILREWRSDWEAKPASPSSIRLIHFGKLLDDKEQLKKYQFSTEAPNVVHMSIRPADLDEEEPKSGIMWTARCVFANQDGSALPGSAMVGGHIYGAMKADENDEASDSVPARVRRDVPALHIRIDALRPPSARHTHYSIVLC